MLGQSGDQWLVTVALEMIGRRRLKDQKKQVHALVLESPFTSTADIAFAAYPFIPVRLLMKDQFRSDERIARVKAPLLVLHGARDRVVPISYGERLFSLANEPKQFVRLARGEHENLDDHGAMTAAKDFLGKF